MFKFSTTHLVNSLADLEIGAEADGVFLKVSDVNKIKQNSIVDPTKDITIQLPTVAVKEKISFNVPKTTDNYRLYLYINSVGNADPLFATDFKHKGRPFYVEFKNADDLVAILSSKEPSKNPLFYGKALATVVTTADLNKANDPSLDTITLEAATPNLRFGIVEIQKLDAVGTGVDAITPAYVGNFAYKTYTFERAANSEAVPAITAANASYIWAGEAVPNSISDKDNVFVTSLVKGSTGFGTYDYLLNNLRLPTNANLRFDRDQATEMPVKGDVYAQVIFKTRTERPEMQGTSVLGQYNQSVTTHILWINLGTEADIATNTSNFKQNLRTKLFALLNSVVEKTSHSTKDWLQVFSATDGDTVFAVNESTLKITKA